MHIATFSFSSVLDAMENRNESHLKQLPIIPDYCKLQETHYATTYPVKYESGATYPPRMTCGARFEVAKKEDDRPAFADQCPLKPLQDFINDTEFKFGATSKNISNTVEADELQWTREPGTSPPVPREDKNGPVSSLQMNDSRPQGKN